MSKNYQENTNIGIIFNTGADLESASSVTIFFCRIFLEIFQNICFAEHMLAAASKFSVDKTY